MKKSIVVMVMLLTLMGCYCRRCWGQSLSLWNNDTVVNATEAAEFRQAFYDLCNYSLDAAFDVIYQVAVGGKIPEATKTATINNAQLNRWFNPNSDSSFVSRAYWRIGRLAVNNRRPPRSIVVESCTQQAPARIADATKRARFINRLDYLVSSEDE